MPASPLVCLSRTSSPYPNEGFNITQLPVPPLSQPGSPVPRLGPTSLSDLRPNINPSVAPFWPLYPPTRLTSPTTLVPLPFPPSVQLLIFPTPCGIPTYRQIFSYFGSIFFPSFGTVTMLTEFYIFFSHSQYVPISDASPRFLP